MALTEMDFASGGGGYPLPSELVTIGGGHEYPNTYKTFTLSEDYQLIIVGVGANSSAAIFKHNGDVCDKSLVYHGTSTSYAFVVFGDFKVGDTISYTNTSGAEWYANFYGVK